MIDCARRPVRHSLALAIITTAVFGSALQAPAADEDQPEREPELPSLAKPKPVEVKPDDDELRKLQVQRYQVACEELKIAAMKFELGVGTIDPVFAATHRVKVSALAIFPATADQIRLREEAVEMAKWFEGALRKRHEAGVGDGLSVRQAEYVRIDLEIDLLLYRRSLKKSTP